MSQLTVRLSGSVAFRAHRSGETGRWISVSDALRITVSGETWQEMVEISNEAVAAILASAARHGELEALVKEQGWSMKIIGARKIPKHARRRLKFDVPVVVLPEARVGHQARAHAQVA